MIRTATPRAAASRIAPPTTSAVSGPRLRSYWARSSDRLAPERKSAMECATSSAGWPPSVKVRRVIAGAIVASLAETAVGGTFNQYRRSALRCERLERYLASRWDAPLLLVGEAAGYRGARVS